MPGTALILVDIQNEYFPGGNLPLPGAEEAARAARRVLDGFRERGLHIFHVRHEAVRPESPIFQPGTPGLAIHDLVTPAEGEAVVTKHYPNSFRDTGLEGLLRDAGVEHVAVCGMMTSMCVDATVRAAWDLGFAVTLLPDACAAPNLEHGGAPIPAAHVHGAFVAAMGMVYTAPTPVDDFLADL